MFEYDSAKSETNKTKHGIDFEEAQALWNDEDVLALRSPKSVDEERWLVIGMIEEVGWTAIVTYRGTSIRIISVRRARKEELKLYGH